MTKPATYSVIDDQHDSGLCPVLTIDYNNQEFGYVCNCGGVHWLYSKDFTKLIPHAPKKMQSNAELNRAALLLLNECMRSYPDVDEDSIPGAFIKDLAHAIEHLETNRKLNGDLHEG